MQIAKFSHACKLLTFHMDILLYVNKCIFLNKKKERKKYLTAGETPKLSTALARIRETPSKNAHPLHYKLKESPSKVNSLIKFLVVLVNILWSFEGFYR